jgi:hypothetical protein
LFFKPQPSVIAGLDPAIQAGTSPSAQARSVSSDALDCRVKPGNDKEGDRPERLP